MGITQLILKVKNPVSDSSSQELSFLIDSGAMYSSIPTGVLEKLGVKPDHKRKFVIADGSIIERDIGGAIFEYDGFRGIAPVIFGQNDDLTVLGATALEAMGFGLNLLKGTLIKLTPTL